MWKKLYDSGYFEDYGTTTADTQTAFFSGQVGMFIESTVILKNAVDSSPFEVGTGYLPRIEQNDEGGVIIGGGSVMYRLNGPWVQDPLRSTRKPMRQMI